MRDILFTIMIGVIVGLLDILPMIKMKLDKFDIASAFLFYLIVPFIIYHTNLFSMPWWLKGGVITLLLALPVMITVAKTDIKSVPPMILMSLVLGTVIGIAGHILKIS